MTIGVTATTNASEIAAVRTALATAGVFERSGHRPSIQRPTAASAIGRTTQSSQIAGRYVGALGGSDFAVNMSDTVRVASPASINCSTCHNPGQSPGFIRVAWSIKLTEIEQSSQETRSPMPFWFAMLLIATSLSAGGLAAYHTSWETFVQRISPTDPPVASAATVGVWAAYVAVLVSLFLALRGWSKELEEDAVHDGLLLLGTLARKVFPLALPMVALGASAGAFLRVTGSDGWGLLALAAAPFIMLAAILVCTLPVTSVRAWALDEGAMKGSDSG